MLATLSSLPDTYATLARCVLPPAQSCAVEEAQRMTARVCVVVFSAIVVVVFCLIVCLMLDEGSD